MKVSKRGSNTVAMRPRYLRRKTLMCLGLTSVVFVLYNYVSLIGKLSIYSDSVIDPFDRSSEKSTNVWKKTMLENEARLGIHVLRPKTPIRRIIVLGERHSGTTFFTKYLQDCFPKLNVGDTFVNNKHWMQHDPEYLLNAVSDESTPLWKEIASYSILRSKPTANHYFHNSFVVVLIRNPYDWVEAMRLKPWHWPNHLDLFPLSAEKEPLNIKAHQGNGASNGGHSVEKSFVGHTLLDWKDFVDRPLYLEKDDDTEKEESNLCQMGYAPKTVSPCKNNPNYVPKPLRSIPKSFLRHLPYDTHNPIYEHNPEDGKPFSNLLELRAAKLRNFLSLPEKWEMAGIGFIQYDNLLGEGLQSLLDEIGSILGIPDSCPTIEPFEKKPYNFSEEYQKWITEAAQWDVEKLIGYYPIAHL